MTTLWPQHTYKEEILMRAWWLHIILVVVWGWNVVVGGWVEFWHSRFCENQNPESPDVGSTRRRHTATHGNAIVPKWHGTWDRPPGSIDFV